MRAHGHVLAVARPEALLVGEDGRRVLAVRRHGQRRVGEDALQRGGVVHQHVAGGGAHEYLDPARVVAGDSPDVFQVAVGRPEVERVVAEGTASCAAQLVFKRPPVGGGRRGIGHLHYAGHTAAYRRPRFGGQRALVREAGLAKMHLVVDQAGEQVASVQIDDLPARPGAHLRLDPADAVTLDENVNFPDFALVDQPGVDQKEFVASHHSHPANASVAETSSWVMPGS